MIDIRLIRKDRQTIESKLKTKDPTLDLSYLCELDQNIRENKTQLEKLKAERNEASQQIGQRKRLGENVENLMTQVAKSAQTVDSLNLKLKELEEAFSQEITRLPNLPMEDIKVSQDPKENVIVKQIGQKPFFPFAFKNHVELNEKLHLFDFKRGAKIAGAGWPVYRNLGARLEWALIQYMIAIHIKNGFTQFIPPLLVRENSLFACGQLPKFENQQFKVADEDHFLYLIPTAEVPLNALHVDEVIPAQELTLKYVAYTPCFRREAGAAGSQERGLIRMHQFNKVEMFCFAKPEESCHVFEQMMASAEEILQNLELHYRNALLVTGDMSFASARTIDIEVWLPGQNRYYEVSSVSNCTDYQSRRSNTRFRQEDGKLEFVHTLNGSGSATSRLMVALLENNQLEDGSVRLPAVLQPYLDGQTHLLPVSI